MSQITKLELLVEPNGASLLWSGGFLQSIEALGFVLDDGGAALVLGGDPGTGGFVESETWFKSGREAFDYLRDHDGSLTLWSSDRLVEGRLSILLRHSVSELGGLTLVGVGGSVPWDVNDVRISTQRAAESLILAVLDACGAVKGWGYDEEFLDRVGDHGSQPPLRALGYWNAFSPETFNLAQACRDAGAEVENRARAVIVRLAEFPWLADVDGFKCLRQVFG